MFWKTKPKLPVTPNDQIWVEESLSFLKDSLGVEKLLDISTVTPTKEFFNRDFDNSKTDAEFILERCTALMDIPRDKITLEFYSEENNYLDDGTLLSTTADIYGKSKGTAGTYQKHGENATIRIETGQLKHPDSLVATIAHELAHEKLLGENRIVRNHEYLTDLTAIAYGFGIFIANTKFQFRSGKGNGFGWKMQSQGYLPEQVSAYAMASLALKKKEIHHDYKEYLDSSVRKYFEQSLAYLKFDGKQEFWLVKKASDQKKEYSHIEINKGSSLFSSFELAQLQHEIKVACYQADVETLEALLQKRLSPNFSTIGGSPLTIAVSLGSKELIDCLLHYGADLNYSDPKTVTDTLPLMAACKNKDITMINYLIDLGAQVNRVAGNGESVLEVAVLTKNTAVVEALLAAGGDIEIKSGLIKLDKTPICAAVKNKDTNMVLFLAENGARIKPIRKIPRYEIHPKMVKFLKAKKYL
ncbi:ankyrin repeat domain-containing protein [Maribacter chungangensis]|uniref:Ankyrin repeat domain-containing protein n=1 Tax=Maribacter chungangensis TaxID=1069117 RepID=A0ABW3B022_9FLAO